MLSHRQGTTNGVRWCGCPWSVFPTTQRNIVQDGRCLTLPYKLGGLPVTQDAMDAGVGEIILAHERGDARTVHQLRMGSHARDPRHTRGVGPAAAITADRSA
jgi:hypothetical protein